MADDDPTMEQILEALEEVPIIDRNAIHPEDNMGGNVICAACWIVWIESDVDWRSKSVVVVTVYDGNALCQDHLVTAVEKKKSGR